MSGDASNATDASAEKSADHNIPRAEFIENVDEYLKRPNNDVVEDVVKRLDEMHQKYKYMEATLFQKKLRIRNQLPELQNSLDMIEVLDEKRVAKETTETRFMLSDQCYAKASVPPTNDVCLFLGANVMLEYPLNEARSLLSGNIETAKRSLERLNSELEFVKDQITTTEVNLARVYNFDVQRRQQSKSGAALS